MDHQREPEPGAGKIPRTRVRESAAVARSDHDRTSPPAIPIAPSWRIHCIGTATNISVRRTRRSHHADQIAPEHELVPVDHPFIRHSIPRGAPRARPGRPHPGVWPHYRNHLRNIRVPLHRTRTSVRTRRRT